MIIYFDNILIATKTEKEHDSLLKAVVDKAKQFNIKFNVNKFQYKQSEIKYCRHIFNENDIKPDTEHVKAVLELKEPNNKAELQRIFS